MGFKLRFWFVEGSEAPAAYLTQGVGEIGALVAKKLSKELGADVTCHPNSELPLGMVAGSHVWRVTWFDHKSDTFREGQAVLQESFPAEECSVCRQWHGREIVHASE